MSRLVTEGFETGANNLTTTAWTSTVGTAPTVVNDGNEYSGDWCMKTVAAAGNSYVQRALTTFRTSGSLFTKFMMKVNVATPSAASRVFVWASSTPADLVYIELLTSGLLKLTNVVASTSATGVVTLSNNTYYRLEFDVVIGDNPNGSAIVRLYSTANTLLDTLSLTAQDTFTANYSIYRLGKTNSTSTFYYDDFIINDGVDPGDGTNMITPGNSKLAMLVSNTVVTNTWDSSAGGSSQSSNIDELPLTIDDTDYNLTSAIEEDRFGLANLGSEVPSNAVMKFADVYARFGSTATSNARMRFNLWNNSGGKFTGPSANANVNGFKFLSNAEHRVCTIPGFTKANLDGFEVGYESITDATERRVSAVWVYVEWVDAAGQFLDVTGGTYGVTGQVMSPRYNTRTFLRYRK